MPAESSGMNKLMNKPTLIFVYNADSGFVNTLLDIGHKLLSPQTYSCNLCAITHSTFSMRDEWKHFVDDLKIPIEFLHRDEFASQYGIQGARLPAVYRKTAGGLEPWISREEINRCRSLEELKRLVERKRQVL